MNSTYAPTTLNLPQLELIYYIYSFLLSRI